MCTSKLIRYTCGCEKEMEFVQCEERQGTNVKCNRTRKEKAKDAANFCSKHSVSVKDVRVEMVGGGSQGAGELGS